MKPRMNITRKNAERFLWMRTMLQAIGDEYSPPSIVREDGAFVLRNCDDIGLALRHNGKEGITWVSIPDDATDDEAEAMMLKFIESLPEPKERQRT